LKLRSVTVVEETVNRSRARKGGHDIGIAVAVEIYHLHCLAGVEAAVDPEFLRRSRHFAVDGAVTRVIQIMAATPTDTGFGLVCVVRAGVTEITGSVRVAVGRIGTGEFTTVVAVITQPVTVAIRLVRVVNRGAVVIGSQHAVEVGVQRVQVVIVARTVE
jgi:hypothetical protein